MIIFSNEEAMVSKASQKQFMERSSGLHWGHTQRKTPLPRICILAQGDIRGVGGCGVNGG